ncbi:MAG: DUF1570 domain-containing protein [Planctomycetota bacterium]|jgi:hypothetical protein
MESSKVRGARRQLGFLARCLVVCLALAAGASARSVSDAQRKRIEKAYAEFQKKGDIPGKDVPNIPWDRALKFDSRFYRIQTNTSRDVAIYIGTLMDAQAVALRKIFQFKMKLKKINIWATRTRQDFVNVAFNELRVPIGPSTGGFWTTARGGTICLPYVKAGMLHPGNVMMHEATHQFLHAALGRDIPIWLNEGLAVLFEESKYNPVKKKLEVFIAPRMRLKYLQREMKRDSHVKLPVLFSTQQMMFTGRHYGAAWSFIYWIFRSAGDDNKEALRRQKAFNKYLFDVKGKKKNVARLFNYLGMKQEEVEKEWKEWVLKLDSDDDRGGTRLKGEPPYEPKPRKPDEEEKSTSGGGDMPESMRRQFKKMLEDPDVPEEVKEKIREKLREGSGQPR